MGRPRRQILSQGVYEICFRTTRGLPFVCTNYMKLVIESILARVQRDQKVTICHDDWQGNHPHIIIIAKDSKQCSRFYGEVQKQLTEAVKRLLGLKHLNLFRKNSTSVIPYGDVAGVVERIAYLYANPAAANLVDTIDHYPGLNTWKIFRDSPHTLDAEYKKPCPWVQQPAIAKLPVRSVSSRQDSLITTKLRESTNKEHQLVIEPNAWMKAFKVPEDEVQVINKRIIALLREKEAEARKKRLAAGWKVMGPSRLAREALTLDYEPKKQSRRIFVYAYDKKIRIAMIKIYKAFCQQCEECYLLWKQGDYTVDWPPGAFTPAMCPKANYFASQYWDFS